MLLIFVLLLRRRSLAEERGKANASDSRYTFGYLVIRSVVCGHVVLGSHVSFSLLVPRAPPTAPPTFLSLAVL